MRGSPGLLKVPEGPGNKLVKGFLYSSWKDMRSGAGGGGRFSKRAEMENGAGVEKDLEVKSAGLANIRGGRGSWQE